MTTPHVLAGDPSVVHAAARSYTATADAVTRAAAQIRTIASDSSTSTSDALAALAENAGDVADRLARLHERYAVAGSALSTYGDALETAIDASRRNAERYYDAQNALHHAQSQVDYYVSLQRSASEIAEMDHAAEMVTYWVGQRTAAQHDVTYYMNLHAQIEDQRDAAASLAQGQIDEAVDNDGLNDSMWDNIKGWVSEHAEFLKALKDALGWITMALSVLSFFIPVLAPFALAAAALTAGLSLLLAASGEISWLEFGLDALTLLTMGVGAVAGRVAAQAVKGLKGLRIARLAANAGTKSPIRVITGSFNSVRMGRISLASREGWAKVLEIYKARGIANAEATRIFTRTRAGAGPLDAFFVDAGTDALHALSVVGRVSGIAHGANTTATVAGVLGDIADAMHAPDVIGDGLHAVEGARDRLEDAVTVEVGSRW